MFTENLLESTRTNHHGRGWATLISFSVQSLLVVGLVAVPILFPRSLQMRAQATSTTTFLMPVPESERRRDAPSVATNDSGGGGGKMITTILRPGPIPHGLPRDPGADTGVCIVDCGAGPLTGLPGPAGPPDIRVITPRVFTERTARISVINPGSPIERLAPAYPPLAKRLGREGEVVLIAIIGRDGAITNVQVKRGDPILAASAAAAVRNWRYRPYILNDSPIEIETQIIIKFRLER
jgi:periplasmic protein TonB